MLFARGSREVPGVTLANVGPSRDSSRPIWAYLACNETTTVSVIAGGALILVAVMMQALGGARPTAKRAYGTKARTDRS